MTDQRSPLAIWLEDAASRTEMAGMKRTALEEQHAYQPDLVVDRIAYYRPVTDQWLLDNGYVLPDTWPPTPIERALDILAPHLDGVPLYRA